MTVCGDDAKAHFSLLQGDKEEIENEIGEKLEWRENPKQNRVVLKVNMDPKNKADWDNQHAWLLDKLELFHKVFSPRIKSLDASEYQPDE